MAMLLAKTEPNYHVLGFCHELVDLGISPGQYQQRFLSTIAS